MRYRNLVLLFSFSMALFVGLNYLVWHLWTEDLLTDHHFDGGDLSRMGYRPASKLNRRNQVDLPRGHIRLKEYDGRPVDLVTIGDSFSNGGGGGRNRFYQDYIASINNLSVLSIDEYLDIDFITLLSILNNNGFFERIRPRYVLIGATERGFRGMAAEVDFRKSAPMEEVARYRIKDHYIGLPKVSFINNGNLKFILNSMAFLFRDHGLFSDVHAGQLSRDLFSVKDSNVLLYLPYRTRVDQSDVIMLNDNLNTLANRLRNKGIQLVYMPYVDKYTLYNEWLVKKRFPASTFFEMLRPLHKSYKFIDTKQLLQKELERGEKDVFYADDTHNSWKASEKIFSSIRFPRDGERRP